MGVESEGTGVSSLGGYHGTGSTGLEENQEGKDLEKHTGPRLLPRWQKSSLGRRDLKDLKTSGRNVRRETEWGWRPPERLVCCD